MSTPMKRYNLVIPMSLYDEVHTLAVREKTTVLELLKRFIRLGLILCKLMSTPGNAILIREQDPQTGAVKEREIILL